MKAIRIHKYGGPEVLEYEQAPRPQPQAGEILIRVHAAGVNSIDWKVRAGNMKDFISHKFPLILGWDVSVVVVALNNKVSRFKKGDEVCGKLDPTRDGAYAEYARSPHANPEIALKPEIAAPRACGRRSVGSVRRDSDLDRDRQTEADD
jgi:NADPH:quinone reductase-like Zn-dependent oxidoreductase